MAARVKFHNSMPLGPEHVLLNTCRECKYASVHKLASLRAEETLRRRRFALPFQLLRAAEVARGASLGTRANSSAHGPGTGM